MITAALITHTEVVQCFIGLIFVAWLPLAELLSVDLTKKRWIVIFMIIAAVGWPIYGIVIDNYLMSFIATVLSIALLL